MVVPSSTLKRCRYQLYFKLSIMVCVALGLSNTPVESHSENCIETETCSTHIPLNLFIREPYAEDQIAGPEVDIHIDVPSNFTVGPIDGFICVQLDKQKEICAENLPSNSSTLKAKLTDVSVGRHTISAWISKGASNIKISQHTVSFDTLAVTKPWWGPYRYKTENTTKSTEPQSRIKHNIEPEMTCSRDAVHAAADLEQIPHFLGPSPSRKVAESKKALVALFAGKNNFRKADEKIRQFGLEAFSFILFLYDFAELDIKAFPWLSKVPVVLVSGQMKWFYLKRFLSPKIVCHYKYIIIVDDDCDMTELDLKGFVDDMMKYQIHIGQPSHSQNSHQPMYAFMMNFIFFFIPNSVPNNFFM